MSYWGAIQEEMLFESFFNSVESPAVVFDKKSHVVIAINDDAVAHFGLEPDALVGRSMTELLAPEDRARLDDPAGGVDLSPVGITLPNGRRHEFQLLMESVNWNGQPAGLAILCNTDETPSWSLPVSIKQEGIADAVLESALEAVVLIDELGVIRSTNPAADSMFGYVGGDLVGRAFEMLIPQPTATKQAFLVKERAGSGFRPRRRPRLTRSVHCDGHEFDTAVSLTQLSGDPLLFCAIIRDVAGDRLEQQRLEQLALTDQITGLANRRGFDDWWDEFSGYRRSVAILLVELQRMSVLVEGFGRQVADEVLSVIGGRLERTAIAAGAQVARSDSGRFLVFAPDHEKTETEKLTKALHSAVEGEIDALGILFQPVLNIGVAMRQGIHGDSASAIAEASVALSNLNRMGVGLTKFGDISAQSRAAQELTMESALRRALQKGELVARMQPVYRMADACIIGAEMLARWTWENNAVSPATFVALAERTGLIESLSRQMRAHALADLPTFIAAADGGQWRTWINISPRELIEASFGDRFLADLEVAGVDPARIGLEVTETALLANPKTAKNTLRELRRAGVNIALDDFGTGFSSLSLLKDIEVDAVKIDRSFTMALPDDTRVAAIIAGIISSVTSMGAEVIAEGVETVEQYEWLAELGCHSAQGFLFTGAIAPSQLLALMGRCA